jgi:hypothetical protein
MIKLFVDVSPNIDILEDVKLWFAWNELSANPNSNAADDSTLSLSGAQMPQFPALSEWILSFLDSIPFVVASEIASNKFLV